MRRVVSIGFALAVVFAGMPGVARAQEATPAPGVDLTRTNVRYFLPFDGDGLNAGLTVTANERGACAHESLASPGRPDAWNCVGETGNTIYDPCFESPFSTPDEPGELACVDSPYTTDVVLLTPTQPLPRFKEADPGLPPAAMPAPAAPIMPQPGSDKPLPGDAAPLPPGMPMDGGSPALAEMGEPLPWALELADGEQCTLATGATAVFAGMRINYFCSGGSVLGEPDRGLPVWAATYLPEGAFVAELVDVAAVWH